MVSSAIGQGAKMGSNTAGDLIARLQAGTELMREMDAAIWLAMNPGATRHKWSYIHTASGRECCIDETRLANGALVIVPHYTSSLDDAMKLVPVGWNCRMSESDSRTWWAELREGYETSYRRVEIGQHVSLPHALCIAALKARAPAVSSESDQG